METQYVEPQGDDGRIRLDYHAAEVRMVVAGSGEVVVRDEAGKEQKISVEGTPRSYELVKRADIAPGVLTLEVPQGLQVYSFTFG